MSRHYTVDDETIDEIGQAMGFKMWNLRDKSKKYILPGNRDEHDDDCLLADDYVEGHVIVFNKFPLVIFQYLDHFPNKSLYTLNLITLRPTKASELQTQIPKEIINKIKSKRYNTY